MPRPPRATHPIRFTPSLLRRFWARVRRTVDPDACWPWDRPTCNGYGVIGAEGTTILYAHRVAYAIAFGDPGAQQVCHRCDNPPCCNPAHLFLGAQADNYRDCVAKRRHAYGERQGKAKLTEEAVREIRRLRAKGARTIDLAPHYGVTPCTISNVCARRTWKHLP